MNEVLAYTFAQAARELGWSKKYIRDLVDAGKLEETKIVYGGPRQRFVTAASVRKLMKERGERAHE